MPKRKVEYSETYKKDIEYDKDAIIELIKKDESKVFILKAGRYDDDKEFVSIKIDNL